MKDHRVVIIGGTSGMGLATARAAAEAGAAVTIAARDPERLRAALATLPAATDGVVADTSREDQVAALFAHVGDLDHLVITAGGGPAPRPVTHLAPEDAPRSLDALWGVVAAVRHAAPRIGPGGSITLTSGTIGMRPTPGNALAAAATGAIEGLTRGLAVELAPIRVNAVRPGVVRTPMWDALPPAQREATFAALAERTLTGTVGAADQIAATNLYLMTNAFVTGTVLTVDGGLLLGAA
jgi:NAD(P)-dependent dehydrogenase (short-subunit alcohol dehydrogenase family)